MEIKHQIGKCSVSAIIVTICALHCNNCHAIEQVSKFSLAWSGGAAVTTQDDYAYVGYDGGVVAIRVGGVETPEEGGIVDLGRISFDIVIEGHYAYVAASWNGLAVVDLSVPGHPELAAWFTDVGAVSKVIVNDTMLYIACTQGLAAISIRNPSHPQLITTLREAGPITDMTRSGDTLYIASQQLVKVVDISDHSSLALVRNIGFDGYVGHLIADGDMICGKQGIDNWGEVFIYSVRQGRIVGHLANYPVVNLRVGEGNLYMACRDSGLVIANVSDPANPRIVGSIDAPAFGIDVTDSICYLTRESTLSVVDITDVTNPVFIKGLQASGYVQNLIRFGQYALVGDLQRELRLWDISDHAAPRRILSLPDSRPTSLFERRNNLIFAVGEGNLEIIDITSPAMPSVVGSIFKRNRGSANGLEIVRGLAYIAWIHQGLEIYDVHDPAHIDSIGAFVINEDVRGAAVDGNYAYVVNSNRWPQFRVIDIADSSSPELVGTLQLPGHAMSVAVHNGFAYVADLDSGLRIIDIDDPLHPVEVAAIDTLWGASYVRILDDNLILSQESHGFKILNISNPTVPFITGLSDLWGCKRFMLSEYRYLCVGEVTRAAIYDISDALTTPRQVLPPFTFSLASPFPNPFNSSTVITFGLEKLAPTRIRIFDPLGRRIEELLPMQTLDAGRHSVVWNAAGVPAGEYIVRLEAGGKARVTSVQVVK